MGHAAPRSADRLSRSRNSFYCQKLAPVKGPYSPRRDRVSQHSLYPPYMGSSARFFPCSQGKVPHAGARSAEGPGAAAGAEAEACPVSVSPWMGEEEEVSHLETGGSAAVSLLGAPGPSGSWLGTGLLPSGHHLVQPQALQLLHQVPAEDVAPGWGPTLTEHRGGLWLRMLRVLGVE